MPLIIISGYPCTGKTTFAEYLVKKLKLLKDSDKIFLINEESLHLNREEFYQGNFLILSFFFDSLILLHF